jgi:hypothetical protein
MFGHLLFQLVVRDVESEQRGSTIKTVTCERCGKEYSYSLKRTGRGRGTNFLLGSSGSSEAASRAQSSLLHKLANDCDPVPCPKCGWYQEHMVQKARTLKHRWVKKTAFALFPLSVLMGIAGFMALIAENGFGFLTVFLLTLAALAALAVPGLPLLRHILIRHYDPNYDPQRHPFR